MLIKIIVIAIMAFIAYTLFSAAYGITHKGSDSAGSIAKALTWRIVLSMFLFFFLFVAFAFGWLQPHGLV